MTVLEKLDDYFAARALYDDIHAESKVAFSAWRAAEYELIEAMLKEKRPVVSEGVFGGQHLLVSLRKQFGCSVTIENEDRIREWLTEVEGSDADFVVEKVNKPALLEHLKQRIDDALLDESEVPDFLKLSSRPGITVRGWKDRKAT